MKRNAALSQAVVLAVLALVGCGGSPTAGNSSGGPSSAAAPATQGGSGDWRPVPLREKGEGEFSDVACTAAGDCWATANLEAGGGAIFHLQGGEWKRAPTPLEALTLYGITCPSRSNCWAVGAVSAGGESISTLIEHYDGTEWTVEDSPDAEGFPESGLEGIVCADEDDCWAAGNGQDFGQNPTAGELLLLRYSGGTWSRVEAPSPQEEELTGDGPLLACGSPTYCLLLTNFGSDGGESNEQAGDIFEGQIWQPLTMPPGIFFQALACTGVEECVALGGPRYDGPMSAYPWNGKGWGAPEPLPPETAASPLSFYSLSCPASGECFAAGGQPIAGAGQPAVVAKLDSDRWTVPSQPEEPGELTAIACPTADSCLAVGGADVSKSYPEAEPLALELSP